MSKRTVIVSAFPCCGKTYAFEHYQDKYSMLDSDSSQFSWMYKASKDGIVRQRVRNPEFPANYIEHIKQNIGKVDIIFVSSHLSVRQALQDAGIHYCTVYPKESMLNEWVGRMYRRGNDDNFIEYQINHWNEFMHNITFEPHGQHLIRLGNNDYLDIDYLYCL